MDQMSSTLQIVAIQHELSMSIGLELQLDKMLDHFMSVAQHRLSLSALHVFYGSSSIKKTNKKNKTTHFLSSYRCFPKQQESHKLQKKLLKKAIKSHLPDIGVNRFVTVESGNKWFYLFPISHFGFIILERIHSPINDTILHAMIAVFDRLAVSCLACLEHGSLLTEIRARKKAEKIIISQTYVDSLTDLPNRKMLNMSLKQALASAKRKKYFCALFFIDLDRFKIINDTLGHDIGDELLIKLADILQNCVRKGDTLARVGGDEFILLAVNLAKSKSKAINDANNIAKKLAALVNKPISLNNNKIHMTFSIGVALFPDNSIKHLSLQQECDAIVKNADIAMYRVKHGNRNNFQFYEKKMQAIVIKRANIEKYLHIALAQQEFELNYQPLVNRDGKIIAAEALIRWKSAELGQINPAEFIPIAEESGLIIDISKWIVDAACQFIAQLSTLSYAENVDYISVNVSPNQFRHQQFVQQTLTIIKKHQIPIQKLRLEVTEGVAMDNIDSTIKKMRKLVDKGLKFLLDDFGTGYSSLSYLHKLPLQTIKIDRSFISNIKKHPNNKVIVDAIIDITENFGLDCIAEGVENIDDANYLQGKNLHAIQGYYFYRPMNAEAFINLLQQSVKIP